MGKKSTSTFGDKRLEKSFAGLLDRMEKRHSVILNQLGETRSEAVQFSRFVNNPKVTPDGILSHYWKESRVDWQDKHLLMISDSSGLTYKLNAHREQLGPLSSTKTKEGFAVHPTIAVNADNGACYGLGGIEFHQNYRPKDEADEAAWLERRKKTYQLPFEEKQSYKWFASPQKAIGNMRGADRYTLIGDRESDTYEVMEQTSAQGWDFVYRNKQDRGIAKTPDVSAEQKAKVPRYGITLYKELEEWEVRHSYDIECRPTRKRSAHRARLEVKFGKVVIKRPRSRNKAKLRKEMEVHVVEVKECSETVQPGEPPIHWILLTSHEVSSISDAMQIVQWYRWRWIIEQCFRTLKLQGLDIESAQLRTYRGLKNICTIALTAALQVMQLVQARDGKSEETAASVFLPEERKCIAALNKKLNGKTDKTKNPYPQNSLAFAAWVIARLGGWKGYQKQKPPGPITFTEGLKRFYDTLEGMRLAKLMVQKT